MENKRKLLTPTEKRIVRLEDGFLTLVQLSQILSGEADELKSRLAKLEADNSVPKCQCTQEAS